VPFRATVARKDLEDFAQRNCSARALPLVAPKAQERGPRVDHPRLIVLTGLPGSGKSTFARALVSASAQDDKTGSKPGQALVVSSDEDGKEWGARLEAGLRAGRRVIVDRCCPTRAGRREILDICAKVASLGHTSKKRSGAAGAFTTALVYFDVDAAECERRAAHRTLTSGHPTVKAGKVAFQHIAKSQDRRHPSVYALSLHGWQSGPVKPSGHWGASWPGFASVGLASSRTALAIERHRPHSNRRATAPWAMKRRGIAAVRVRVRPPLQLDCLWFVTFLPLSLLA